LERWATRGFPQEILTLFCKSKLAWPSWRLPHDDQHYLLRLQKRVMQKVQQSWHSIWQALAKDPAPWNSINASKSTDVLALHQFIKARSSLSNLAINQEQWDKCFSIPGTHAFYSFTTMQF
jgi:hypothetical protein